MKLTQRFGPIPVTTTLDGSGNGTVTFQSNGSSARITNLFVKVSTSTAQATCTIYKGQVADGNAINTTNSGSTGAAASGAIDLTDGEVLYVRWTGGDAGATATATFTGITIPFDEVGPSSLEWADPIAAGDGSLIYPALKSPNYVPGSAGWKIDRDGDAEFNDVTIRGVLEAVSPSGAQVSVDFDSLSAFIDVLPPPMAGHTITAGQLVGETDTSSTPDITELSLVGPLLDGTIGGTTINLKSGTDGTASIEMIAPNTVDVVAGTGIALSSPQITLDADTITDALGLPIKGVKVGSVSIAVGAAAVNANQAVTFPVAFPVLGQTVYVFTNLNSGSAASVGWKSRAIGESETGFTANVSGAAPGGSGFTATVKWFAFMM